MSDRFAGTGPNPYPNTTLHDVYAYTDPPGTTPTDRQIWQSHGVTIPARWSVEQELAHQQTRTGRTQKQLGNP